MRYWLMKSEPSVFSIDDLRARGTEPWDGVRNYQARNFMRDMRKGDQALFYHSNCPEPGVAGLMEVAREAYPDHTAWSPEGAHYDPASTPENPRWFMVDVKWRASFAGVVTLGQMRQEPALKDMLILKKGQRLSVMPVTGSEFRRIVELGG